MLTMENLEWTFSIAKKYYKARVIYESSQIERIKVEGDNVSIVIQSDRPFLELQNSKKKIKWKLIEGIIDDAFVLNRILADVEFHLKHHDDPPFVHPKNNQG
jgi:hypothetical protein